MPALIPVLGSFDGVGVKLLGGYVAFPTLLVISIMLFCGRGFMRGSLLIATAIVTVALVDLYFDPVPSTHLPGMTLLSGTLIAFSRGRLNIGKSAYITASYVLFLCSIAELTIWYLYPDLIAKIDNAMSIASTYEAAGFRRIKAMAREPAHLAIIASVLYYCLLGSRGRGAFVARLVLIITVALTQSLSGIWLLLFAHALKTVRVITRRSWSVSGVFLVVFIGGSSIYLGVKEVQTPFIVRLKERIEKILEIKPDRAFEVESSEGSRIASLLFPIYFMKDDFTSLGSKLFGVGIGAGDEWIGARFSHLGSRSSLASGKISNIWSSVLVALGLTGLSLFVLFLICYLHDRESSGTRSNLLYLLAVGCCYGAIAGSVFWVSVALIGGSARFRKLTGSD